jgi:outer membrane receptor protein involved in Fe transport
MKAKNKPRFAARLAFMSTAAALLLCTPLYGQDEEVDQASEEELIVEEVIVTGSRIARSGFDTMMPTVVVDSQAIDNQGATNIADSLSVLPQFGAAGQTTEGDQSVANIGSVFVDLFGLGSQRTLTLVNGRRFVGGNSPTLFTNSDPGLQVDFNMLPSSMVERVEVITIGGAPIYGTDAIAGTVNVIMKSDYEGMDLHAQKGWADESPNVEEDRFSVVLGGNFDDGRGNLMAGFEWTKREGLAEFERSHLRKGWQFREPAEDSEFSRVLVENAHANIVSRGGAITPGPTLLPSFGIGSWGDAGYLQFAPDGSIIPYDVGTPTGNAVWSVGGEGLFLPDVTGLFTPVDRKVFAAFGKYDVYDWMQAYGEFFYANSNTFQITSQSAYQSGFFGEESYALNFSVDHPLLTPSARQTLAELGTDDFWMHRASIDLRDQLGRGGNESEAEVNMWRAVGGLRGTFDLFGRYWDWDVAYINGQSDSWTRSVDISSDRFFYALDVVVDDDGNFACRVTVDPSSRPTDANAPFGGSLGTADYDDCVPLDIFGEGRPSPEALEYIQRNQVSRTSLVQTVLSANITTELFDLPAGGLGFAAGYEQRSEQADFDAGGWAQSGYGRSVPIGSVSGGYDTKEWYGEFFAPLISPDMDIPLVFSASIEGAYRYVDNSLAGSDDTWTIGGRYAPIEMFELRGNVTESVRAPAVTELFLPRAGLFSFANDPCDQRFVDEGPNPSARRANCIADGIDPDTFVSNVANASVNGFSGGNPNLLNETAESWTAGVVIRPLTNLQIAIDYVDIDLVDAIQTFTLTQVMESCYDQDNFPNTFCTQFTRQPDGQLPPVNAFQVGYVNAGLRVLKAWTFEAAHSADLFGGNLLTQLYAYIPRDDIVQVQESIDDSKGEPDVADLQAQLALTYSYGDWLGYLLTSYRSEATINNDDTPTSRDILKIGSWWAFDAMVSWQVTDTIRLQANVNNIFDERPEPAAIASGWDGVYDNLGRYYKLGIQLSF